MLIAMVIRETAAFLRAPSSNVSCATQVYLLAESKLDPMARGETPPRIDGRRQIVFLYSVALA